MLRPYRKTGLNQLAFIDRALLNPRYHAHHFTHSASCFRDTSSSHTKSLKRAQQDMESKIGSSLGIKHHPVDLYEIIKESEEDIETESSSVNPNTDSESVPEQPAKSFQEIMDGMRARQLNYLQTINIPKKSNDPKKPTIETIHKKWIFHDVHSSTDQQTYLSNVSEGDLIETWAGNMGVVVQVPDFVNIFKYAVLDHHGSVEYYPSARSFAVKIPQFIERKSPTESLDPIDSLSSFIRVIEDDSNSPVVTVVSYLRKEVCPRIKQFIKHSQSLIKNVEVELENMFSELQESADPINVSLFEVAFAVEKNLHHIIQNDSQTTSRQAEKNKKRTVKENPETESKEVSNHNKYDILKAHFPPHGFEGSRRQVNSVVLYTVYTSIGTMFNKKVLFDFNDHPTPNTLTLLPFSLENEQDRAIDAMRYANQSASAVTSFFTSVEEGISIKSPKGTPKNSNPFRNQSNPLEQVPALMKDLLELEKNPSCSRYILGTEPKSTHFKTINQQAFTRTPDIQKVNRGVINVIQRFATKDITSKDLTTLSVVSLFLKHLEFFRSLNEERESNKKQSSFEQPISSSFDPITGELNPPTSAATHITETYALNFLRNAGIISVDQNPLRLQSKLQPIEAGVSRIQKLTEKSHLDDKYHNKHKDVSASNSKFTIHGEQYESNGLPDRVSQLRQELPQDLTVYCIDSADAHEIDDGISVANTHEPIWKVYIHIADPASALMLDGRGSDGLLKHAYKQTSTAYYPEAVIPMFPSWFTHSLGLIQQTEQERALAKSSFRRCLTFEIDFDSKNKTFDIDGVKIYPAVTRSIHQITYDQVNKILGDPNAKDKTALDLRNLFIVANAFSKYRFTKGGALALRIPRPNVKVSRDVSPSSTTLDCGLNVSVNLPSARVSNELVAEFMILCNHATARYMSNNNIPGMYRSQKILAGTYDSDNHLKKIIQNGTDKYDWSVLPWTAPDPMAAINKGIGPKLELSNSLTLLNKIKSATLGVKSQRHSALGIDEYMHATSPLRRFQDVVTHWQIQSHLLEKAEVTKSDHKVSSSPEIFSGPLASFRAEHHLSGAYVFDPSQIDTMSIRLMRNQTLLKRASQQSNLFWMLQVLSYNLGFTPGVSKRQSSETTCIITSKPFFGFQNAYSVEHGVFVTLDLQQSSGSSFAFSGSVPKKRLYDLGESVKCSIVGIDQMQSTVTVRPL